MSIGGGGDRWGQVSIGRGVRWGQVSIGRMSGGVR